MHESGRYTTCEGAVVPAIEQCDGVDADCDGVADTEDADLGATRSDERCNSADDDCDGRTDEDCGCSATEEVPCGTSNIGRCRYGIRACDVDSGTYSECRGNVEPEAEACDGIDGDCDGVDDATDSSLDGVRTIEVCNGTDDDCDGDADEDFRVGSSCMAPGVCGEGLWECDGPSTARCSSGPGGSHNGSRPEECDVERLDEDCDGSANEACACSGAIEVACGTSNVGECRLGRQLCDPSTMTLSECHGALFPRVELCDGLDSDCDGSSDAEDADLAGMRQPEVCNRVDDDCDGSADEDFALGTGCTAPGTCGPGSWECDEDGSRRCSSAPGGSEHQSADEKCDETLRDEDCDGEIDESCGCSAGPRILCGMSNVGRCRYGIQVCDATRGQYGECQGAIDPQAELCDGVDGDCDGIEDALDPNLADVRRAETCNRLDDDCDGSTDEGFAFGTACTSPGVCGDGHWECNDSGGSVCSSAPGGSASPSRLEVCDTALLDEDCDGAVNEGCECAMGAEIACGSQRRRRLPHRPPVLRCRYPQVQRLPGRVAAASGGVRRTRQRLRRCRRCRRSRSLQRASARILQYSRRRLRRAPRRRLFRRRASYRSRRLR